MREISYDQWDICETWNHRRVENHCARQSLVTCRTPRQIFSARFSLLSPTPLCRWLTHHCIFVTFFVVTVITILRTNPWLSTTLEGCSLSPTADPFSTSSRLFHLFKENISYKIQILTGKALNEGWNMFKPLFKIFERLMFQARRTFYAKFQKNCGNDEVCPTHDHLDVLDDDDIYQKEVLIWLAGVSSPTVDISRLAWQNIATSRSHSTSIIVTSINKMNMIDGRAFKERKNYDMIDNRSPKKKKY